METSPGAIAVLVVFFLVVRPPAYSFRAAAAGPHQPACNMLPLLLLLAKHCVLLLLHICCYNSRMAHVHILCVVTTPVYSSASIAVLKSAADTRYGHILAALRRSPWGLKRDCTTSNTTCG
jgi:hypothetical protein